MLVVGGEQTVAERRLEAGLDGSIVLMQLIVVSSNLGAEKVLMDIFQKRN